jgi:hypothetical protein
VKVSNMWEMVLYAKYGEDGSLKMKNTTLQVQSIVSLEWKIFLIFIILKHLLSHTLSLQLMLDPIPDISL